MPVNRNREDYRFYKIWADMKQRCTNPKCASFYNYGGRGIQYDLKWMCYENFKSDMYPSYLSHCEQYGVKQTTLDRIDVNDHYYKNNCRWATYQQQSVNIRDKEQYCGYNLITNQIYNFDNCSEFCRQLGFIRQAIFRVLNGEINMHHNCIFAKVENDNWQEAYKVLMQKAKELYFQYPKLLKARETYMESKNGVKSN